MIKDNNGKYKHRGDHWLHGTITKVRENPHRHFIMWDDMKPGQWIDLGIETWYVLGKEPLIDRIVKDNTILKMVEGEKLFITKEH